MQFHVDDGLFFFGECGELAFEGLAKFFEAGFFGWGALLLAVWLDDLEVISNDGLDLLLALLFALDIDGFAVGDSVEPCFWVFDLPGTGAVVEVFDQGFLDGITSGGLVF